MQKGEGEFSKIYKKGGYIFSIVKVKYNFPIRLNLIGLAITWVFTTFLLKNTIKYIR